MTCARDLSDWGRDRGVSQSVWDDTEAKALYIGSRERDVVTTWQINTSIIAQIPHPCQSPITARHVASSTAHLILN